MASSIFLVCVPDYREPAARVAELLWLCLCCDCGTDSWGTAGRVGCSRDEELHSSLVLEQYNGVGFVHG